MTEPVRITLDVAQLFMLGGLIWGLAKMSSAIGALRTVTSGLTKGVERIGITLADMVSRVRILEDRSERRAP